MEMREIIAVCREKNATIDHMMAMEGCTLDGWIEGEKAKLVHNASLVPLLPKDDLVDICGAYINEHIGKEAAKDVTEVMAYGILFTADHLGGLYSAQSFQGDLCYTRLLKKLDAGVPCVPLVSFGLVPLNSTTFGRGLITYGRTKEAEHFPIFPYAPSSATASLTESYTKDMLRRTKDKAINEAASFLVRKRVRELADNLYLRDDVLAKKRYADQVLLLGQGIYERLSSMTQAGGFYHMEAEALFAELFIREFSQKDGLLRQLLCDASFIEKLNAATDFEGREFSSLLFRGCADKRAFFLNLYPDGYLRGTDVGGAPFELRFDEETVFDAIRNMRILPHTYLSWLMAGFFRGFTWYGGILQSQYLQDWQKKTCEMLSLAGYTDIANQRAAYDCSGYLSGPVYLLFDTRDGAVNAGPLECMAKTPQEEALERIFTETDIAAAHEMGMFEFYNDLVPLNDKKEGWYETIARYCREHYEAHTLQSITAA